MIRKLFVMIFVTDAFNKKFEYFYKKFSLLDLYFQYNFKAIFISNIILKRSLFPI